MHGDDDRAGPDVGARTRDVDALRQHGLAEHGAQVHKPDRLAHYQRAIDLQHRGMRLARDPVEIVEVPYEGATLPAYFMKARNADGTIIDGPAPCIVQWNGFDSFKEHMLGSLFPTSWPAAASRR